MVVRQFHKQSQKHLLFIQSTAQPWQGFLPAVEQLAKHYHVMLVTPDGHDPEEKTDFLSVEHTAAQITQWLRENGVNSLDALYGLSIGGGIAMRLLAENNVTVRKAVIDAGTAPYRLPKLFRGLICLRDFLFAELGYHNRKIIEAAFPPERFTPEGHDPKKEYDDLMECLESYSMKTVWNVFWSANNYTMPKAAPETDTEMEFWYGSDEEKTRSRDLKWATAYFPYMKVRVIPHMEHGEYVTVHPKEFANTMLEFLLTG